MAQPNDIFNEADLELAKRLYPGSFGQVGLYAVLLLSTPLLEDYAFAAALHGALLVLFNLGRLKLGFYRASFAARAKLWRHLYLACTLGTAITWGSLNVMVLRFYELNSFTTLYSFVNLCGIAAAGMSALSPRPFPARLFLAALLFPPVVQLCLLHSANAWPVAALTFVYFLFLAAQAGVQGKSFYALHEAMHHYHAIADNSGEGILIHQGGKLVDVNTAGARMFGHRVEEMLGRPLSLIIDAENLARAYAESAPHSGRLLNYDGLRADGTIFPMEVCAIDCQWNGKPARAVRVRDLTEARRVAGLLEHAKEAAEAEVRERTAELRQSETRFEAVIEQSPLPKLILGADGSVTKINRAARKLWAVDAPQAEQGFRRTYNVNKDPNWEEQGMLSLLEEGWRGKASYLPSVFYEPGRVQSGGSAFWMEAFVAPIKRADGSVAELTLTIRDITHRRRAEADRAALEIREKSAVEASRLKSEFLANMSHEIRTPMNGVLGMTDILLSTPLTPEQRDFSETIKRSGEGLLTLLNDILDFSKIEAGKLEFEKISFSLPEKVRDVERAFSVLASGKDIIFNAELGADLPAAVRGDPVRVMQVLNNFVGNAVKFTNRGHVKLRVNARKSSCGNHIVRIEVADTGSGISPEVRSRLFEPFSQADASTTRKFGGTGLGLSITKRLVEMMQGTIGVESTLGEGSCFWAEFTLEEAGVPAPQHAADQADVPLPHARILLAEDNLVNQKIAARMLERMGLHVDLAVTGIEALDALGRNSYDLVLMDVQMPEMDGLEASRAVRSGVTGLNRKVPIVALTANALQGDEQICLASGMNDYLTKPITADRLRVSIRKWLGVGELLSKSPGDKGTAA